MAANNAHEQLRTALSDADKVKVVVMGIESIRGHTFAHVFTGTPSDILTPEHGSCHTDARHN